MSDPTTPSEAGWHPDPYGRHELRYWDGGRWTVHVSDNGEQSTDAATGPAGAGAGAAGGRPSHQSSRVQQQVQRAGGDPAAARAGGGTLFSEPVLVVNQKAKLIELSNEYSVFDQHGTQIGSVRQVGQSKARKLLRLVTDVDQFLTHRLEVCDTAGTPVLKITRPAKIVKSTVVVSDGDGNEVGRIVQQNMVGKIRFSLEAGGQPVGALNAENWRAWDFHVADAAGTEVARITKTWEGLAKTMFTTADNYVVKIHRELDEPLRSLVVASALSVDTALKQDSRGLS